MSFQQADHSSEDSVDHVIEGLKKLNIRITPQRRAVLAYLINSHHHPTAEEIYTSMLREYPGMSLATVYNNLNTFVREGLVREMKFSGVTSRYDFMGHTHYHIICENCGKVVDFAYDDLKNLNDAVHDQTGFIVNKASLEVHGLCPACQSL